MSSHMYAILLKISAVTIFTVLMAIIKETSDEVPTGQQVFFRAFFTLLVIMAWLTARKEFPSALHTKRISGHLARGLWGGVAMASRFFALGVLSFPEIMALSFTTPLILTLLAAVILGEHIRSFRIITVCLGFLGVLIILWPTIETQSVRSSIELIGIVAILCSATAAALAQIYVRKLTETESNAQIVFYLSLIISLLSLFTIPFGWIWPSNYAIILLIIAGIIGGIGQICLTAAYRYAPASVVAPFDYTSMLLALAIGYFWFAEIPTLWTILGATIIIASGIVIIWREHQLGTERNHRNNYRH